MYHRWLYNLEWIDISKNIAYLGVVNGTSSQDEDLSLDPVRGVVLEVSKDRIFDFGVFSSFQDQLLAHGSRVEVEPLMRELLVGPIRQIEDGMRRAPFDDGWTFPGASEWNLLIGTR